MDVAETHWPLFEGMIWRFQLAYNIGHVESGPTHSLVMPCVAFKEKVDGSLGLLHPARVPWRPWNFVKQGGEQKWNHNFAMKFGDYKQIWVFPEIGVSPNHPF